MQPKPWMSKLHVGDYYYYSIRNAGLIRLIRFRATKVGKSFVTGVDTENGYVSTHHFDQRGLCANEKLLQATDEVERAWSAHAWLTEAWYTL